MSPAFKLLCLRVGTLRLLTALQSELPTSLNSLLDSTLYQTHYWTHYLGVMCPVYIV